MARSHRRRDRVSPLLPSALGDLVARFPAVPPQGLAYGRGLVQRLDRADLEHLRRALATRRLGTGWRVALEAALVVDREAVRLGRGALADASRLPRDAGEALVAQLTNIELDRRATAINILQQLALELGSGPTARSAARALYDLGLRADACVTKLSTNQGAPAERLRAARLAAAIEPEHLGAVLSLARELESGQELRAAARAYRRAAAIDPGRGLAALLGLGRCLVGLGKPAAAIAILSGVLARCTTADRRLRYATLTTRARAHVRSGNHDDAYIDIDEALGLDATSWEARALRAELFERDGLFDEALDDWRAARMHAPASRQRVIDRSIRRIRAASARNATAISSGSSSSQTTSSSGADDHDGFMPAHITEHPRETFDDYVGARQIREVIEAELLLVRRHRELAARLGIPLSAGFALFGPPGTGKTLLARVIAGILRIPMLSPTCGNTASMWLSRTEARLEVIGHHVARELGGAAVVFFDEVEGFCPAPEASPSGRLKEQIGLQVLKLVDYLLTLPGVVVVAASNRRSLVNNALLRAGRLSRHIELGSSSADDRAAMFRHHLRRVDPDGKLEVGRAARAAYSPAEIAEIATSVARRCLEVSVAAGRLVPPTQQFFDEQVNNRRPRDLKTFEAHDGGFVGLTDQRPCGFNPTRARSSE